MTNADAIKILLFIWKIVKIVTVFVAVYGFMALKYTFKAFIMVLPILAYVIVGVLGGVAGGAADAAASKASSHRPYHRVWGDE